MKVKSNEAIFTIIELDGIKHISPAKVNNKQRTFAAQKKEKKKEFLAQK